MALQLTGDRDQALLALVVKEARQVAAAEHCYVGRTAMQKMMYFLKRRGVSMSYRFDIHHYGPYCEDIVTDIDWLLADGVIKDMSSKQDKYSNYAPDSAIEEILNLHRESLAKDDALIRDTVAALITLKPNMLEVIATLDYLLRSEKATGRTTGLKAAVVEKFMQVKKDRYEKQLVESMYDTVARIVTATP